MWLRTRLLGIAAEIRDSYWFVPALIAMICFAAGLGLIYADAVLGDAWLGRYEWLYGSRPEGARAVLSTVAGSTITVAGVVFSITLAAVTYASGQYGPRLLSNFARDRGNQVTLGVFIGTFLYCLVVLRTIRSAEEASAETAGAVRDAFVPHLAMFGALALAVASMAVLIYFVHHVTDAIHVNNLIARIGRALLRDVKRYRDDSAKHGAPVTPPGPDAWACGAPATGYLRSIDADSLLESAARHEARVTLLAGPGDFVHRGRPLLLVEGPRTAELRKLAGAVAVGRKRSPDQDLRFLLDELVEIAARALSPGVNDPFTAVACIDWLGAALSELDRLPPLGGTRKGEGGRGALTMPALGFVDFLDVAAGRLRHYAARDPIAGARLHSALRTVAAGSTEAAHRALLEREMAALRDAMDKGTD
ncbi:DUF2254 domain-containing protein [Sphingomonas lenta]|nr:DUF2254 domain-containing protein [Sphingomonas lenta]